MTTEPHTNGADAADRERRSDPATGATTRNGPLDAVTVVALEHAVAAPFATRQLADLGARVIKVERPGVGDFARSYDHAVRGEASYFVWLNRGKESIELDLKDPIDRAVLDAMIARADVVVQNLMPGAVDRLGLDAATVRARHPALIYVSISGYGTQGSYRKKKAYDALIQAEAGLIAATGSLEHPAKVGASVADIATGMYAYTGTLTALYHRERTGQGSTVDIAMIDALGEWMAQPAYYSAYGGRPWVRTGARHGTIAPYGPYRCGDGDSIYLSIQNDREWAAFAVGVLDRPALVDDPRFFRTPERVANNDELTAIIEASFADKTTGETAALLDLHGIANGAMRSPSELFDHPALVERGRWRDVESPGGTIRALLPPVTVAGQEARMGSIPALGQHNAALRAEFRPPPV